MRSQSGVDVETYVDDLIERLIRRFEGQAAPEAVEGTVRRHAASFANARVAEFVPVLVERRSVKELTATATGR